MSTWIASSARVTDALRRLSDAKAQVVRASLAPPAVVSFLEAYGRVLACGAAVEPPDLGTDAADRIAAALASDAFDCAVLEDEGVRLAATLLDDDDAEGGGRSVDSVVKDAFGARDRVEHALLAAEHLAAPVPILSRDQQMFLVEFDHLVRPLLPRLTAFNGLRGETAASLAPPLRRRFWWWCEGVAIAPTAATSLAAVAELIACFPDAQSQLDGLVAAARALRATAASPATAGSSRSATVTSLAEWTARHRKQESAEVRVAAASIEERVLVVSAAEYEISWRPPHSVIVDLKVVPRGELTPGARMPSGRVLPSTLVPRTLRRYVVELDADAIAEDALLVVIPLADGDVEIPFPPPERRPR